MALNYKRQLNGLQLVPQNTIAPDTLGEMRYNSSSNKLELYNSILDSVVLEASAATLTNKLIDANTNTISNLTNSNLSGSAAISNANLASMPDNTFKGNISGITATPSDLTANQVATAIGAVTTIGAIDGNGAFANGLSIVGAILYAQSASVSNPGMVNNTTQSFSGNKTFTGSISASNLSGTNSGDITLTAVGSSPSANAASLSGQVLTLQPADATHPGVITAISQTIGGSKVFASAPAITDTSAAHNVILNASSSVTLTADRTLTIDTANVSSTLKMGANLTVTSTASISGSNSGDVTLAAVGSSPNANAASLSGQILNLQPFSSAQPGVVTASGGGTTNFLRADGSWATPTVGAFSGFSAYKTTGQTVNAGDAIISFDGTAFDTSAQWDGGHTWTVPATGYYQVSIGIQILATTTSDGFLQLYIEDASAVQVSDLADVYVPTGLTSKATLVQGSKLLSLTSGQTLRFHALITNSGTGIVSISGTASSTTSRTWITVAKVG